MIRMRFRLNTFDKEWIWKLQGSRWKGVKSTQINLLKRNLKIRQDWYIHYVHIPHRFKQIQTKAKTENQDLKNVDMVLLE